MTIHQYIETGIVESYALGLATPEDSAKFERMLLTSPELKSALLHFELQLEAFSMNSQAPPPPDLREKIQDRLRELPAIRPVSRGTWSAGRDTEGDTILIKETSSHIRVHKNWRAAFIAIVVLAKIMMALAIYYYVVSRQADKEIQHLEQHMKSYKTLQGE